MASEDLQSDLSWPPPAHHDRSVGAVEGRAGQDADRRAEQQGRPQQSPAASPRTIAAAGTSARTAWSISSAPSSTPSARSSGWNTIRTAPPSSRWSSTRTASWPTSSRRSVLAAGDKVVSSMQTVDVKPGNAMPLERMPVGTIVHNVEMKPRKGGQIARSAGAYAQYVGRDAGLGDPSPQLGRAAPRPRHLPRHGRRGVEPGPRQHLDRQGRPQRAGSARKPVNRGVTMNPVDHPHGGGEGRTSGGRHPVSPVGQADQGQEDPQQQVDGQVHRPLAVT